MNIIFFRPERSLPMRLYSLNKRSFFLVLMAFFVCFLLAIFIGLGKKKIFLHTLMLRWKWKKKLLFFNSAGPEITTIKEIDSSKLIDQSENLTRVIAKGPFKIQTQFLSSYARQLWVFAKYQIENIGEDEYKKSSSMFKNKIFWFFTDETFDTSFLVSVQIKGLTESKLKNIDLFQAKNHTRHLKCKGDNCEEFTLVHLGWLEFSHYQFIIKFHGLNHKRYNISKLTFYLKSFNPAFTSLEISFRLIFLFFTFVVTIWFYMLLRRHPSSNWTIEQKFTYVLLPLLIFYDSKWLKLLFYVNI